MRTALFEGAKIDSISTVSRQPSPERSNAIGT